MSRRLPESFGHMIHSLSKEWMEKAGHDVSGQPRDDHGRWVKEFSDWHEQAGRSAHQKTDMHHANESESHRERLMELPLIKLRALADHVGFHIRPGLPKEKIVTGLIGVVNTRRGMAQRSEQ